MQLVVCLVVGFLIGCQITSWKYEAQIKTDENARLVASKKVSDDHTHAQNKLQDRIKELNIELAEKEKLLAGNRSAVNRGERIVYVDAECPTPETSRSDIVNSPGGNIRRPGRLSAAAEQDYLEYERRYAEQLNTFKKCVAYARATVENTTQ